MRSRCEGASQPNAPGMPKIIAPANPDVAYFFTLASITATRRPISHTSMMAFGLLFGFFDCIGVVCTLDRLAETNNAPYLVELVEPI
jgi:hypothetical protein